MDLFRISNYPDFTDQGAPICSETFPDAFFPEESEIEHKGPGGSTYVKVVAVYQHEKEAKALCAKCPYKLRCLEYAVNDPSLQGIWGGTTDRQRRTIRGEKRRSRKVIRYDVS